MTDLDRPVWYASYGSNLLRRRFLAYLEGGAVPRSTDGGLQRGSRDTSLPTADQPFELRHQLLFAHSAARWGDGAVAKLSLVPDPAVATQSRAWRITLGQLEDVFAQENRQIETAPLDLPALLEKGSQTTYPTWYGTMLAVGSIDDEPVLTFTGPTPTEVFGAAHVSYLRVIADGLAELRGWDTAQAASYLAACPGHLDTLDAAAIHAMLEELD